MLLTELRSVYLAARYSRKHEMVRYARALRDIGVAVTSEWLAETHAPNALLSDVDPEWLARYAQRDLRNIREADALVYFTERLMAPRGGRHFEAGYAYGVGKPVLVVGPKENVFCYVPEFVSFKSKGDLLKCLRPLMAER